MKFGVNRHFLLTAAGIVWIGAGINILRIGLITWRESSQAAFLKVGEVTVVFLLFFIFVFRKLYFKHTRRIDRKKEEKNCPFGFFDIKGWIIMGAMITLGIIVRTFRLLPDGFIAVFYTGLSLALIYTGILFIRYRWKKRRSAAG